ncbi:MAG: hypothetical protein K5685_13705 [Bacteroidales bacterium]|nr:hypothetical protein [Bacteroidales bacterium]
MEKKYYMTLFGVKKEITKERAEQILWLQSLIKAQREKAGMSKTGFANNIKLEETK